MADRTARWQLWLAVALVALSVRVAGGIWWQSRLEPHRPFFFPDSYSYWHLGKALAEGKPYQLGPDAKVFRTPGYPILLAGVIRLFGDGAPAVLAARMVGALLGVLTVLMLGLWGQQLGRVVTTRPSVPYLAASLAAIYPGAIAMSVFVLSEALFCPLLVAQMTCWTWCHRRQESLRTAILAGFAVGLFAGLATLCRPSWLLFTPLMSLVWLFLAPRSTGRGCATVAMWIGLVLVMLPWSVRNFVVTGHWVPTTLQVGASLYDGLNPRATGASDMSFVERFWEDERKQRAGNPSEEPLELTVDRRMFLAAVNWARMHPAEVLKLAIKKEVRMWSPWPNDPNFKHSPLAWAFAGGFLTMLVTTIVGLYQARSAGWAVVCSLMPALYLALLHAVFVASIRYREPAVLCWCVPAAIGISNLFRSVHWRVRP